MTLNFSCAEKKTSDKEANKSVIESTSKTNTLKFILGIRSIFQDSKGNYWFGSLQEGVAVYNGKSFKYFTNNDGLTDNLMGVSNVYAIMLPIGRTTHILTVPCKKSEPNK